MATKAAVEPVMRLTAQQALALRLSALLVSPRPAREASSVDDVVTWLAAMQAQDAASGLWSLGVRLPGWTVTDVTDALERREALRTWPMRGTIHLVPARDARWMLELMGERPLAAAARRREVIGLAAADADRSVEVLRDALTGGGRLTRAQCLALLLDAGIQLPANHGYHLLWYASQLGVTCIAPDVDGEQTFVLLDEWVPEPVALSRDEALVTIAHRYVRGHGPVPVSDLAGWTGLTLRDVRRGLALAADGSTGTDGGDVVVPVDVDGTSMVASSQALAGLDDAVAALVGSLLVLPGFDEFMLGFKDRTLMLDSRFMDAVVPGGNGMFRPTIVRDGRVIGTWTRSVTARRVTVSPIPLVRLLKRDRAAIEAVLEPYATFLGRDLVVRWP